MISRELRQRLCSALGLGPGEDPFPWQEALLERLSRGDIPPSLDIPTGLGKTATMAIWLVARSVGAKLPRRLVYVVDRRAVVDQATTEAEKLRAWVERDEAVKAALELTRPLPISTLRGQHVDNREWLEDPTLPAIVVGTVDMVGSRVLFEGYGVSRKMRPYHAGFLGADTVVVLDEAHLVPPFERLLEAIAAKDNPFGSRDPALRALVPRFALLSLSATGRDVPGALTLTGRDLKHDIVKKRLGARKRLEVRELDGDDTLPVALAREAWELAGKGMSPARYLVFCDQREDARKVLDEIRKLARGSREAEIAPVEIATELFVGGRRVFEREAAARRLADIGFLAGDRRLPPIPVFLIATSAAEVGVDLDADHMVCDLVAWERMIQRLGRVNRRGDGDARVVVIVGRAPQPLKSEANAIEVLASSGVLDAKEREKAQATKAKHEVRVQQWRARKLPLDRLSELDGGGLDASPGALRRLKDAARSNEELAAILKHASTVPPLRPALTRPLVDAWSMTSLKAHTGRPEIQPWLRGWIEEDEPQTSIVWRCHLPACSDGSLPPTKDIEAYFEAAPPHVLETLETETRWAIDWLVSRGDALARRASEPSPHERSDSPRPFVPDDVVAIVLSRSGDLRASVRLHELRDAKTDREAKDRLRQGIANAVLVVNWRIAGLGPSGLLDDSIPDPPGTVDDDEGSLRPNVDGTPQVRFRVRVLMGLAPRDPNWRPRFRLAVHEPDDGEPAYLVVEKWRHDPATEEDRAAGWPQLLDEHEQWVEDAARALADRLELPPEYREMLCIAARLHDEGKRADRWQRAFSAPKDGIYAKTMGPVNIRLLDDYRHELGSLHYAEKSDHFLRLPGPLRDLALHLIAAHHGFARPSIGADGCDDAPPSAVEVRAREVARRFARLQHDWGPWGLAWWESLLRAADQQASRRNDERGER